MEEEKEVNKVDRDQVWPGTSVRGRAERGHDIVVVDSEGAGRAEQGHDIVMGMNVKGAGGGRSVQGRDIIAEKNVKGAGGEYQEGAREKEGRPGGGRKDR